MGTGERPFTHREHPGAAFVGDPDQLSRGAPAGHSTEQFKPCWIFVGVHHPGRARPRVHGEEQLAALGWSAPTYLPGEGGVGSANWWLDVPDGEVERVAWLLVATLREVYAVPHPAFLESGELELSGLQGPDAGGWSVAALPVVSPQDSEHLQRLVDQTLTTMLERPVKHDEDGDVPWPCG